MRYLPLLGLGLLLSVLPASAQITNGQSDDFQDGTLQGWRNGAAPSAITNVNGGGPGGAGDRYLQVTSDGGGSAGKLVVFNTAQWSGNYTAAGVTTVALDVNNTGPNDLVLRLWLEGAGGTFVSTTSVNLPSGSGWRAATFSVTPAALTFDSGINDVAATLADVFRFRIYHGPAPTAPGPSIVAVLGLDNITAGPVPSPDYDIEAANTTPLTVAPGGSVGFSYAITNNTAAAATGDLWYTASPGGASGVIRSGTLPAGATITGTYTQNIPPSAPSGNYTYTLRIGRFPSPTLDAEAFTLTVTPAAPQAEERPAEWTVRDVSPWFPAYEAAPAVAAGPDVLAVEGVPAAFVLLGAYPNPFGTSTAVRFDVAEPAFVTVEVLDGLGRRVAVLVDGPLGAGAHVARWEAGALPSGVYLVRMMAGAFAAARRVTLLR